MLKKLSRKCKHMVAFLIILTMLIPSVSLAAPSPWHLLPEIAPYAVSSFDLPEMLDTGFAFDADDALQAPDQATIDALQDEEANLWRYAPGIYEAFKFDELINSRTFLSLLEYERTFILQYLDIAESAFGVANELFLLMEQDGFTLAQSVDLVVILSGGLFSYSEAVQLLAAIPDLIERNTEIYRFEQFTYNFDRPWHVNARVLRNNPHETMRRMSFVDMDSFFVNSANAEYSFIDAAQVYMPSVFVQDTLPVASRIEFEYPPEKEDEACEECEYEEEEPETPEEPEIEQPEQELPTLQTPPTTTPTRESLATAFTNESAFNAALQLFLTGHGVAEIETAFTLGAALQAEPQAFLLQPSMHRAVAMALDTLHDPDEMPIMPIHPLAMLPVSRTTEHVLDLELDLQEIDEDELEEIIEDGMEIMSFGIAPMSAPFAPIHANIVGDPFGLHFNANESVSLNTGTTTFRTNVLSLPGRGGLDLNLDLIYSSADAAMARPVGPNITMAQRKDPHGLGIGWRFDLPYIWDDILHIPGRGSFTLNGNQILGNSLNDMQLIDYSGFASSNLSTRRLRLYNGTTYFFMGDNANGQLIGIQDRYGNTIRFNYAHNHNTGRPILFHITDSNGRHISIQRREVGDNVTVTVVSPDNSNYVINMTRNRRYIDHNNLLILNSIQNQAGAITRFDYEISQFSFCWSFKTPRFSTGILLLRQVNYPSGAQLRFAYGFRDTNLGIDGILRFPVVTSRELFSGGRVYQRTTFSYQGDPTAFPSRITTLPAHHTYTTTVTQNNGLRTVYTFNSRHHNTLQRTYNASNVLLSQQTTTFHNAGLPLSIVSVQHHGNFSRTTTQRFEYNNVGQVTRFISPLANGAINPNARYVTTQTYDARFGLPLVTTFMTDASTTIREVNRLSTDGRNIVGTDIYQNNVRQSRTNFLHDSFGNVTEIREFPNATGTEFVATQIVYNSGTMPSTIRTTGVRDAYGNLITGAGIGNNGVIERRFVYDTMWRLTQETDPMGYITRWQYDRIGRVTRVTHPNGGVEVYTYNDQQNTLTHQTILGATYTHRFDGFGNLRTITAPDGMVILTNTYDNRMRLTDTRNAQGIASSQRTTFVYDVFDRIIETRHLNAAGEIMLRETIAYNDVMDTAGNRRITTTLHGDANAPSIVSFVQFDRFGRVTQEGVNGGRLITYTHDLAGRVTRERSLGVDNTFTHGIFGVTSVRNIEGNTSSNTFDAMGRLTRSTDFMGNQQRFIYDNAGRLLRQYTPFEHIGSTTHYAVSQFTYDRNGNITRSSVATNLPGAAREWSHTNNTFQHNRLMSSQTGDSPLTEYTYNLAGNILTMRVGGESNAAVTTFTYNNRGQLTRTTDALGQTETMTYDANGNLLTRTDRNGTLFRMTYDNMGRLVREEAVQNGVVTAYSAFTFTATGAVRTQTNGEHTITNTYDAQGRLIRQAEDNDIVRTFAYNEANNVTDSRVYIGNNRYMHNTYTFDAAPRVRTVTSNGQLMSTYTFNANGARTSTVLGNGTTTNYTRNLAGLVTRLENRHGDTLLSHFENTYYLDGNMQQVIETMQRETRTITYTYDSARRLIREQDAGFRTLDRQYTFDNRGNRTHMTVTGDENYEVTYTYDLNNRLLTETRTGDDPSESTFTYDRNGNQLSRSTTAAPTQEPDNPDIHITSMISPGEATSGDRVEHTFTVSNIGNVALTGLQLASILPQQFSNLEANDLPQGVTNNATETADGISLSLEIETLVAGETLEITISTEVMVNARIFLMTSVQVQHSSGLSQTAQANLIANPTESTTPLSREILPMVGFELTSVAANSNTPIAGFSIENDGLTETRTYTYNAFNQLVQATSPGTNVTYTYRADGLRRNKTINGTTTTHVWMGSQIVLERRGDDGAVINRFHRSASGRMIRSEHHGWYLHNARRDVVQRVNDAGAILRNYRYSAFGVELDQHEGNTNPFRWNGEYWDWATSTYYLRARHFSPRTGRFSQPDPFWNVGNMQSSTAAIMQSSNLYLFTMHNPIRWADPTGLFAIPRLPQLIPPFIPPPLPPMDFLTDLVRIVGQGGNTGAPVGTNAPAIGEAVATAHQTNQQWQQANRERYRANMAANASRTAQQAGMAPGSPEYIRFVNMMVASGELGLDTAMGIATSIGIKKNIAGAIAGAAAARTGRATNHLRPDPRAVGSHSTYRVNQTTGQISNAATWRPNPQNPTGFDLVYRVDFVGGTHTNSITGQSVPTPHVHGKFIRGGVVEAQRFDWERVTDLFE